MSISENAQTQTEQASPSVLIKYHVLQPEPIAVEGNASPAEEQFSVVTGLGVTDIDEPEITPIRMRSAPSTPSYRPLNNHLTPFDELDTSRGRPTVIRGSETLTKNAKKRLKRKQKLAEAAASAQLSPAMNTTRGFDSAAEDSDTTGTGYNTPKIMSPQPRLAALAGASPYLRSASPGVSGLKMQLDALNLGSTAASRSASRNRSTMDSGTSSTGFSNSSGHNTEDEERSDIVSYEIPLDQDFISPSMNESEATASLSAPTLCADQRASSMINRKMAASDFNVLKCLGKGTYGTVMLVKQHATGRLFAQKQFKKASLTVHKKLIEQTKTERSILESVNRHPFIVNLYYAFQDREKLYLILEYAQGGELFHHLSLEKMFAEPVAAFYMAELVLALDHLHNEVGVIYRDLKPENCLLDSEGHLLLTDFGLSKVAVEDPGTPGGSRCNSTGIGTIEYMAPEVIRGSGASAIGPGYGKACDWWSFGALGYDLLTGSPPFRGNNYAKIQQNILKQKFAPAHFLSLDAKDLMARLLRKEPSKRLGAKGANDINVIKTHRFFRKIDWKALERREVEPPIRPFITDPEAAENFDAGFTGLAVSPTLEHAVLRPRTLSEAARDPFGGFSFVASRSLLEEGMLAGVDEEVF